MYPVLGHSPAVRSGGGSDDVGQLLSDHLRNVAQSAAQFASQFEASAFGYITGLLHDVGKVIPEFQAYLRGERDSGGDHKLAGSVLTRKFLPAALAIDGHHGGLNARRDVKAKIVEALASDYINGVLRAAGEVLELPSEFPASPPWLRDELACELFTRMLFSVLVDADFLDTEAHFSPDRSNRRTGQARRPADLAGMLAAHIATLKKGSQSVRHVREEVYRACLSAASLDPGVFRLTVPTGGGKTLSSMAFALHHAVTHGLRRVIVAIPYTSIIEQNADVYRAVFGATEVLEHHSAIDPEHDEPHSWSRLAAENWDAPIIVTTTVQLFESLFARKTSRCRKLHNIAGSVIILDEVQTLPAHLLEPILSVLRDLAAHYHVSIVLSSATQPAFEESQQLRGLGNIREIVPTYARHFDLARRVEYGHYGKLSWSEVAQRARDHDQVLIVLNTKQDAVALLEEVGDDALHLSAAMCGAHRRAVLAQVSRRLNAGEPCRLVSTQVIEAGVDLDFPCVMRAVGPLDRIVQAAGRCNREGRHDHGQVLIFEPTEGRPVPPGAYRSATDLAAPLLRDPAFNFHNPDAYTAYFRDLWGVVDVQGRNIQDARRAMDYPATAHLFRLIDDAGVPAVVHYRPARQEIEFLLNAVRSRRGSPRELMRKLQPFVVSIGRHAVEKYARAGWLVEVTPGLYEWSGKYDEVRGITTDSRDPEDLIV